MNRVHKTRINQLIFFLSILTVGVGLILYALRQNLNVFVTPTQLIERAYPSPIAVRLGGIVKTASVRHDKKGVGVTFTVTDLKNEISVLYRGILPDLFREGKGVIVEGQLVQTKQFIATRVLAKHDENYMPKKIYTQIRTQAQT